MASQIALNKQFESFEKYCGCNTSIDILLRKIGEPAAVSAYIKQIGIQDMRIDRYTLEIIADSE